MTSIRSKVEIDDLATNRETASRTVKSIRNSLRAIKDAMLRNGTTSPSP